MDEEHQRQKIRAKAYELWVAEGRPEGRADAHWDMATELVAIEDNHMSTLKPVTPLPSGSPIGEPVEPLLAVENTGEFPTLTDQGEEAANPRAPQPANEKSRSRSRT
jgi:hypothetical protein